MKIKNFVIETRYKIGFKILFESKNMYIKFDIDSCNIYYKFVKILFYSNEAFEKTIFRKKY